MKFSLAHLSVIYLIFATVKLINPFNIHWMAPFFSGGGYCSEAISYIQLLQDSVWNDQISIDQHGDSVDYNFISNILEKRVYETLLCPPSPNTMYTIGRTMFETDRLPSGWKERINALDEVWVPTSFHKRIFLSGGVNASKIRILHEAVDTVLFHPPDHTTETIERSRKREDVWPFGSSYSYQPEDYKFLSVFKWEIRKGWDILLSRFNAKDRVILYILTNVYHGDESNITEDIEAFEFQYYLKKQKQDKNNNSTRNNNTSKALIDPTTSSPSRSSSSVIRASPEFRSFKSSLPRMQILPSGLSTTNLVKVYQSVDCLVQPSRGEGWGRPHVEAMSTGLPVIATNWSGNTEFMNENNSFLIHVDHLEPIQEGAFKGHYWAHPNISHLSELMFHVFLHPEEGRVIGEKAREDMLNKYSYPVIRKEPLNQLRNIET